MQGRAGLEIQQLGSILALLALVFTYPPPPPRGRRLCLCYCGCLCESEGLLRTLSPKDQDSRFTLLIVASDGGGVDKETDPILAISVHGIRCRGFKEPAPVSFSFAFSCFTSFGGQTLTDEDFEKQLHVKGVWKDHTHAPGRTCTQRRTTETFSVYPWLAQ